MKLSTEPGSVTIALRASDFDVAKQFYGLLDFVVDIDTWIGEGVIDHPFRRLRMLLNGDPRLAIEFMAVENAAATARPDPDVTPVVSFVVLDFDEVTSLFQSRAKSAIVDSVRLPYANCMTLKDPFGNHLQVFSS